MTTNRRSRETKRVLLSLMALALLGTMGAGTYALFTATSSTGNNTFASANLSLTNDKSGSALLAITNMVPGDTVTGIVNVTNNGGEDLAGYALDTTLVAPATPNALTTDTTNGLKVTVTRCSAAWTGSGFSATCGAPATQTTIVTTTAIASGGTPAGSSGSISMLTGGKNAFCATGPTASERTARGTTCDTSVDSSGANPIDHLKVTVTLPSTAGNSLQNLSGTIGFSFYGQNPVQANF